VGALLRAIDGYDGSFVTRQALRLAPLVFVRPGELRHAEWVEFDLDKMEWKIPANKMKMRIPHRVPLATQAVAILNETLPLTGRSRYVFPSIRSAARPMSENTLNAALRRMGYTANEATAHGFRSTATVRLNEMTRWQPDVIERQLAHLDPDSVRQAYNHAAEYWADRVQMMQVWADYLDELRARGSSEAA
jgi:integrase